jgi:hypothetical protein
VLAREGIPFVRFAATGFWPKDIALYRSDRWQIELYFKRLKSLPDAGHMSKSNDASAKGWMQAQMLSALLLERIMLEAGFFPWGYHLREEPVGTAGRDQRLPQANRCSGVGAG